jgi:hypothetical protein
LIRANLTLLDELCSCLSAARDVALRNVSIGPTDLTPKQAVYVYTVAVVGRIIRSLSSSRVTHLRLPFCDISRSYFIGNWDIIDTALSSEDQYPALKQVVLCLVRGRAYVPILAEIRQLFPKTTGRGLLMTDTDEVSVDTVKKNLPFAQLSSYTIIS